MVVVVVKQPGGNHEVVRHNEASGFKVQSGCLVLTADVRLPNGIDHDIVVDVVHAYGAGCWHSAAVK
jgi:hypothetical protein